MNEEVLEKIAPGQQITLKYFGRLLFERIDTYCGERSVQLYGIDNHETYYLLPTVLEAEGYMAVGV